MKNTQIGVWLDANISKEIDKVRAEILQELGRNVSRSQICARIIENFVRNNKDKLKDFVFREVLK